MACAAHPTGRVLTCARYRMLRSLASVRRHSGTVIGPSVAVIASSPEAETQIELEQIRNQILLHNVESRAIGHPSAKEDTAQGRRRVHRRLYRFDEGVEMRAHGAM